jgi:carboxymethylenebutenolidase
MGKPLTLVAADSHKLGAYRADPAGQPKGGVVGFCMGGTIAYLAACRLSGLSAAVCYYGGGVARFAGEKPNCPTQMHFGEKDAHIPLSPVEEIKKKRPECEVYVYQGADHGFHCDERGSYNADSARIAWGRSMGFLEKNLKG